MSVYIKGMEMPKYGCDHCFLRTGNYCGRIEKDESVVEYARKNERHPDCPLVPVPPHGDLIDRDALIKDGWLNLHKEVMRMGGYAIHELPLKNPSIAVIIPAEEGE